MKRTDGTSPIADVESSIPQGSTTLPRPRPRKARIVMVALIGLCGLGGLAGMGMSMRSWRKETHPSLLLASAVAASSSSSGRRLAASASASTSSSLQFELFASDDDGSKGKDNEAQQLAVASTAARAKILSGGAKRGTGLGKTPLSSFMKRSAGEARTLQEDTGGTQRRLANVNSKENAISLWPFRLAEMHDGHFSISCNKFSAYTRTSIYTRVPMIFIYDGTVDPRHEDTDQTTRDIDFGNGTPTGSTTGPLFGNKMVQIGQWRIAAMDTNHLSIGHKSGEVSRIFRSDSNSFGNVPIWNGWNKDLGSPTCAFVSRDKSTDYKDRSFLQLGDWRIGTVKQEGKNPYNKGWFLVVGHISGNTNVLYREDGEITGYGSGKAYIDFSPWKIPKGEVLGGISTGCPDRQKFGW